MHADGEVTGPAPAHRWDTGARLDRLPVTRWLMQVMGVLFLSWFVEAYDIGLTGTVLPSLARLYDMSTLERSLLAVAANAGVVVGIVPAGWLADRIGRKSMLVGGTLAYAVVTCCTGLAGDVQTVIAMRFVAGLAMGAVFPLPYAYASELAPANQRGRVTGLADAFLSVGYFIAPLLASVLIPSTAASTGWRLMFFIGGAPVLSALLSWLVLPESPRWYEVRGRLVEADRQLADIEARVEHDLGHPLPPLPPDASKKPATGGLSLRTLVTGDYRRRSIMLWVSFGGVFFTFYAIQTFLPTVVQGMGFSVGSSYLFTAVIVGISIFGKLAEAFLVESLGRKVVIVSFTGLAAIAAFAFGFARGAPALLVIGGLLAFFGIGVDPAVKIYTAESYPTKVRASATSLTEGIGRLLSGVIGPALIPPLLAAGGPVAVFATVGVAATTAAAVVAFAGQELGGCNLEAAAS